jgi:hypothetical protein
MEPLILSALNHFKKTHSIPIRPREGPKQRAVHGVAPDSGAAQRSRWHAKKNKIISSVTNNASE